MKNSGLLILTTLVLWLSTTGFAKTPPETVVYVSNRPANWDIYLFDKSNAAPKRLTDDPALDYNAVFSPERDPRSTGTTGEAALTGQPFNANTINRGISANDFYLAVPSAVIRFLETDSETKVIAKPQLRGAEGAPLELNLG